MKQFTYIEGRLTSDPEARITSNGNKVVNFRIANNNKFKNGEEAFFIECKAWGQQAEFIERYFKKGKPIQIMGRLSNENWESKDGEKRSRIVLIANEISFVPSWGGEEKKEVEEVSEPAPKKAPKKKEKQEEPKPEPEAEAEEIDDDDIPF